MMRLWVVALGCVSVLGGAARSIVRCSEPKEIVRGSLKGFYPHSQFAWV